MLGHSGRFGTITPACSICHNREIGLKCINFGSYGRLVNENKKKEYKKKFVKKIMIKRKIIGPKQTSVHKELLVKKKTCGTKKEFWSKKYLVKRNFGPKK